MAFDDLSTNREPNAGSLVAGSAVEPLEDGEDLLGVFLIKADARVSDRDQPTRANHDRFDPDLEFSIRCPELQSVSKQVLQELLQLRPVALDGR